MEILTRQFGLITAYILPGFVALAGISPLSPIVAGWLRADQSASFGAPLYALLAAAAMGMVASAVRWMLLDQIHLLTGVTAPVFSAQALQENSAAFNFLVESHYRFYQFYGNMLVAVICTYSIYLHLGLLWTQSVSVNVAIILLCVVLFAGSRDALQKYRKRTGQLAGQGSPSYSIGAAMTNGIDHNQGEGGNAEKPPAKPKSEVKPSTPAKPQAGGKSKPS